MKYQGFVYLLSNPCMPGVYKIGRTKWDVHKRARTLSQSTSVPVPFHCLCYVETEDASRDESELHSFLCDFRVSFDREFFRFRPIHMPWVFGLFEYHPKRISYWQAPWYRHESADSQDPDNPWDRYDYKEPVMTRYSPPEAWEFTYLD